MAPAQGDATKPRTRGRARWGSITRDQIIHAAVGTVRAGGYEQMTIRGLAADLGVSPMALYHHIRGKDDLLDEIVDRLLARAWRPKADPAGDWRAWIAEAAENLRRFLVTQPVAIQVYLNHPVVSPAAAARMNSIMAVLRRALGDDQTAQCAYGAIHTYTIGFAALEASRSGRQPPKLDQQPTSGRQIGCDVDPHHPPASKNYDLVQQLAAYTTRDQFTRGLTYLLDGIERGATASRKR
jgi:TetR/AcrR family tetracycline transcriptional repressor